MARRGWRLSRARNMAQWRSNLASPERQKAASSPRRHPSARGSAFMDQVVRRRVARGAPVRSEADDRRHGARGANGAPERGAGESRLTIQAPRLALDRMVLAGWHSRFCDSVLPRASTPDGARAAPDARGGRWYRALVHAA